MTTGHIPNELVEWYQELHANLKQARQEMNEFLHWHTHISIERYCTENGIEPDTVRTAVQKEAEFTGALTSELDGVKLYSRCLIEQAIHTPTHIPHKRSENLLN